jgi:hypothetical protein
MEKMNIRHVCTNIQGYVRLLCDLFKDRQKLDDDQVCNIQIETNGRRIGDAIT